MSKEGIDKAQFSEYIELGKRNSKLIPLTKNWCKHLEVIDSSAGMIAEIYNLPTRLSIGCPHSSGGYEAANFEWIATDFIRENCLNCKFHDEVSSQNIGVKILAALRLREQERMNEELALQMSEKQLENEVQELILKDQSEAKVTTLSILKLVQGLRESDNRKDTADKILEAAKLSPSFFSQGASDYLGLYFAGENGEILIQAIDVLNKNQNCLSNFIIERLEAAIKKGNNFDHAVGLLSQLITKENVKQYHWLFEAALDFCDYKNDYGMREDKEGCYPHSVNLFISLYNFDKAHYTRIISNKLLINDKYSRININGLLTDLCEYGSCYIEEFTELLIKSFEFADDNYGSSADLSTRMTLKSIYLKDQEPLMAAIARQYGKLSVWAKMEIVEFYENIVSYDESFSVSEPCSKTIIDTLVALLLTKSSDQKYQKAILDAVGRAVKKRPFSFIKHFDALLGFLVNANQKKLSVEWQIKEVQGSAPVSTFNPLIGKSLWEIEGLQLDYDHILRESEKIVTSLIKGSPEHLFHPVISMINNLSSRDQEDLKASLITVLQQAMKDPIIISTLLPSIYNFLLDKDSEKIRFRGMRYLIHLIDQHPNLLTQTLLDLIYVFVNDIVISIQIKAIDAIGGIIRAYPEQITPEKIELILSKLTSKYVYVRFAVISLLYKLYSFLKKSQLEIFVLTAMDLELYFFGEKDYKKGGEIIDILLYSTVNTKIYDYVVKTMLVKYCDTKDFYVDEESLAKLTSIAKKHDRFQELWLDNAVGFLMRTQPERHNPGGDKRKELFDMMYKINPAIVVKNISVLIKFATDRINLRSIMDILDIYAILAHYRFYTELRTLIDDFEKKIERCIANEGIYEIHDLIKQTVTIELAVQDGKADGDFIKSL